MARGARATDCMILDPGVAASGSLFDLVGVRRLNGFEKDNHMPKNGLLSLELRLACISSSW